MTLNKEVYSAFFAGATYIILVDRGLPEVILCVKGGDQEATAYSSDGDGADLYAGERDAAVRSVRGLLWPHRDKLTPALEARAINGVLAILGMTHIPEPD